MQLYYNMYNSRVRKLVADSCINLIKPYGKGSVETRMVQRSPDYLSLYVSSHSGCKMRCKFCWLTQQEQFSFDHVPVNGYVRQVDDILRESKIDFDERNGVRVNVNMMARGEPLANKHLVKGYPQLYDQLDRTIQSHGFSGTKINLSTIMPYTMKDYSLYSIFQDTPVTMFYSLYSLNPDFRKKWIPNGIPVEMALDKLAEFQQLTNNPVVFHWTLIEGENDDPEECQQIVDLINCYGFDRTKFNLVRFNPHPKLADEYREPTEEKMNQLFELISDGMTEDVPHQKSRIVPRVGYDAYVSCGMFAED